MLNEVGVNNFAIHDLVRPEASRLRGQFAAIFQFIRCTQFVHSLIAEADAESVRLPFKHNVFNREKLLASSQFQFFNLLIYIFILTDSFLFISTHTLE